MITVKKTDDGNYVASIKNSVLVIDRHSGHQLKKEVTKILAGHRKIDINLMQVNAIDKNGYYMLEQLIELAEKKNCKLHFTNYGTDIAKKIQMLQYIQS